VAISNDRAETEGNASAGRCLGANATASVIGLSAVLDRRYTGLEASNSDVVVIDDPMDHPVQVETILRH
jgi:hypothetical protein